MQFGSYSSDGFTLFTAQRETIIGSQSGGENDTLQRRDGGYNVTLLQSRSRDRSGESLLKPPLPCSGCELVLLELLSRNFIRNRFPVAGVFR